MNTMGMGRIFGILLIAFGLSACVQLKENGAGYTGVDTTKDEKPDTFSSISAELMKYSMNPGQVSFTCQNRDGSQGLVLERDPDTLVYSERYFERASDGKLLDRDLQNIHPHQDPDLPGTIFFFGLKDAVHNDFDRNREFYLRIEGDTPKLANGFIPTRLYINHTGLLLEQNEFFCLPVGITADDEWGYLLVKAHGTIPELAAVRLRGLEAQTLYKTLKAAGATDKNIKGVLPETLVSAIATDNIVCAAQAYSRGFTSKDIKTAYNCAFLLDHSGNVIKPKGAQWGPLLAITQYAMWLLNDELLAKSPRRSGAPGFAYQQGLVGITGGVDLVEQSTVNSQLLFAARGYSAKNMYTDWLKDFDAVKGSDPSGNYSEKTGNGSFMRCSMYERAEKDFSNYVCKFAADSKGVASLDTH